jgi:hypothetical protein
VFEQDLLTKNKQRVGAAVTTGVLCTNRDGGALTIPSNSAHIRDDSHGLNRGIVPHPASLSIPCRQSREKRFKFRLKRVERIETLFSLTIKEELARQPFF